MVDLWCHYLSYQTSLAWRLNRMVSSRGVSWQEGEATYRYKTISRVNLGFYCTLCAFSTRDLHSLVLLLNLMNSTKAVGQDTEIEAIGWLLDVHNQVSLSCVSYVAMATLTMDSVTFSITIWYQKCTKVYDSVGRQWNSTGLKRMCRHLKLSPPLGPETWLINTLLIFRHWIGSTNFSLIVGMQGFPWVANYNQIYSHHFRGLVAM